MNGQEVHTIKLSCEEVCENVSAEIEVILGTSVQCQIKIIEDEFWDIAFQDHRLPMVQLCQLLSAVKASPGDWAYTIPTEVSTDIRYTGTVLAEKLLSYQLKLTWEHSLVTTEGLLLIGVKDREDKINVAGIRHVESRIQQIPLEQLHEVINNHTPTGLFLSRDNSRWIAVDNSDSNAWTEEFSCKFQAVCWLHGELREACGNPTDQEA